MQSTIAAEKYKEEETRLIDQHEMLKEVYHDWNNGLYPAFIGDPEAVLDCGFGTGNWAYDMAEYDPSCLVSAPYRVYN
jgi:ubiquinone/menaquinone biosynthesis C-methylase UbiE